MLHPCRLGFVLCIGVVLWAPPAPPPFPDSLLMIPPTPDLYLCGPCSCRVNRDNVFLFVLSNMTTLWIHALRLLHIGITHITLFAYSTSNFVPVRNNLHWAVMVFLLKLNSSILSWNKVPPLKMNTLNYTGIYALYYCRCGPKGAHSAHQSLFHLMGQNLNELGCMSSPGAQRFPHMTATYCSHQPNHHQMAFHLIHRQFSIAVFPHHMGYRPPHMMSTHSPR